KGKMTLPMIHFLRTAPAEHRALLRSLLASNDADKVERIRNLILPSPSIGYARGRAREYVDRARRALHSLPDNEARRVLDTTAAGASTRRWCRPPPRPAPASPARRGRRRNAPS